MRRLKNLGFLLVVLGIVGFGQGSLLGFYPPPTFEDCSDGCTCSVNSLDWTNASAECPDTAGVDECDHGFGECADYCEQTLPAHHFEWFHVEIYCIMNSFGGEGCDPEGLEPPTNWTCSCLCFES